MLYASQIPRIGFFFCPYSLICFCCFSYRWCSGRYCCCFFCCCCCCLLSFYLSFDCYRKRHSFDRFVFVFLFKCVCANVFSIYFINYIIDYILRVICANENFVLQLILCREYIQFSIYLSHIGICELIQAQVRLLNLPNTTDCRNWKYTLDATEITAAALRIRHNKKTCSTLILFFSFYSCKNTNENRPCFHFSLSLSPFLDINEMAHEIYSFLAFTSFQTQIRQIK